MLRFKYICLVCLITLSCRLYSQSDFDFSQRMLNQAIYNPAATANKLESDVFLHGRTQWVGLEGAPTTEIIGTNIYLKNAKSGLGIVFTGDQIGFTESYSARFAYSYFIPVLYSNLSLGLSASFINRNINAAGALVDHLDDPNLYHANASTFGASFDFGFEYGGPFKIGAAVRNIGAKSQSPNFKTLSNNIWTYASASIGVNLRTTIEPQVSYMHRERFNRYEAGVIMYLSKAGYEYYDYWIGGMIRFHGQFSILGGIYLSEKMKIGYSFDYAYGDLGKISKFGTHEIYFSWQIGKSSDCATNDCPAYTRSHKKYNYKNKKKTLNEIKKRFEVY